MTHTLADRATTAATDLRWFSFGVTLGSCAALAACAAAQAPAATTGMFAMLAALGSALFVIIGPTPNGRC
ncbi:MAG TPA: hypothetical protein VFX16_04200 [Pseudonocardiaceae bacterium]|nr:hypothetical protein [Pseudonocardiaceae bacterium]